MRNLILQRLLFVAGSTFSLAMFLLTMTNPLAAQSPAEPADQSVAQSAAQSPAENNKAYGGQIESYLKVNSFESLSDLAKDISQYTFDPMPAPADVLAELDYSQYRQIEFKYPRGVWWGGKTPFWFESFHRGFLQQAKVELFTLIDGKTKHIPYNREDFDYHGVLDPAKIPADTGHAGLKIVGRFPRIGGGEEMLTFLGSSYFRSRPDGFSYGASARALAVNIAMTQPEEFPALRAFWIQKPVNHSPSVTVLGLLDSPRVTGAYEFEFTPGTTESKIRVKARLHFRHAIEKLAIAPITSMWMWGDGFPGPENDNRPAVHDSDGVLIQTQEDGWVWRPFSRHSYPSVSSRQVKTLLGFGALQRNIAFFHFEDYNANYHKRPSVFVKPKTPWTNGRIEFGEFPSAHEGIDNIGTYWVFNDPVDISKPMDFEYDVSFLIGDTGEQKFVARATAFTVDRKPPSASSAESAPEKPGPIDIEIRFSGEALKTYRHNVMPYLNLKVANGKSSGQSVRSTETGDFLVTVTINPDGESPVDIELFLEHQNKKLTETFLYLCPARQAEIPKE